MKFKKVMLTLLAVVLASGVQAQKDRGQYEGKSTAGRKEVRLHKEVFYKIRESDNVEYAATTALREIADFMAKYSDAHVTLTGYADRETGNPTLNVMYALNRATKFKNDLVTRYGVDADRIIADSRGDVEQPFRENDKNRCVIVDCVGYEVDKATRRKLTADEQADAQRRNYRDEMQRRYEDEMGRHRVDTMVVIHKDTVWVIRPEAPDTLRPERPFRVNRRNIWYNWFITFGAGPGIFQGDHNVDAEWKDRVYPSFDLSIGKWIVPAIGLRAGLNLDMVHSYYNANAAYPNPLASYYGEFVHGASPKEPYEKAPWLYRMRYNTWNFHADVMVNFSSFMWAPYNRRFWNLIGHAGVGCIATWDNGVHDWFNHYMSWNVGVLNSFRLNEHLDINIDLSVKKFDDDFNCWRQGRGMDGMTNLMIGCTWHFTKRGF